MYFEDLEDGTFRDKRTGAVGPLRRNGKTGGWYVDDSESQTIENYKRRKGKKEAKLNRQYTKFGNRQMKLQDEPTNVEIDSKKVYFIKEDKYEKQKDEFYSKINEKEKEVLSEYISSPQWFISKTDPFGEKHDAEGNIRTVNNLFKTKGYKTEEDTLLYRRGRERRYDVIKGFKKEHFVSTSAYEDIPKKLPSGISFGENEYYIVVPKGINYLPIENVAVQDVASDKGGRTIYKRQHEILLEPNLKYEMVKELNNNRYILKVNKE